MRQREGSTGKYHERENSLSNETELNDIDEDMDLLGAVFRDETCRKAACIRVYISVGEKKNEAKMFKFKSVFFWRYDKLECISICARSFSIRPEMACHKEYFCQIFISVE